MIRMRVTISYLTFTLQVVVNSHSREAIVIGARDEYSAKRTERAIGRK